VVGAERWALLGSLRPEDRQRVLQAARRRIFAQGEIVFREGDPGDSLHLVEAGVFAVQVSTPGGDRATVNILAAGSFFGEMALLQDVTIPRRTATVVALVASHTLTITGAAFTELLAGHPPVERLMVAALAQRVEDLGARLLEALYVGVDRRVYRRLVDLAQLFGAPGDDIVIPLSQDDLATMAGASRPTVNQVLQKLLARGTITLGRRKIVVKDFAGLRAMLPAADD
jgi:CRP/FNR family transcriptional regulator, cyclic AMP receptor protein